MRDHLPHIGTCFMAVPSIRKPLFFRSSGPRINVHHWRLACFFGRARFDDQILWSGSNSLEWFQRIYGTTISGWSWASWVLERTKFVGPWIHFVQFCVGCSAICVAEFPKLMLLHIYVCLFLPVISCYLLGLCWFPCLGSCYPQSRSIGYHNVSIYIYICIILIIYIYIYTVYWYHYIFISNFFEAVPPQTSCCPL